MTTKFKSHIRAARPSFGGAVCAGAVLLIVSNTQAQNLFVSDYGTGNIYELTPDGAQSTFATGLTLPYGLAFNSTGDLFEADAGTGNIYEYTTGGAKTIFAGGLGQYGPGGLAFNSTGNLFVTDYGSGSSPYSPYGYSIIYEYTPGRVQSLFASGSAGGLGSPIGLAFNSAGNLFVSDASSGNIYEFTPNGAQSTFASGLSIPFGLVFNSAGDLFEADAGTGSINEFTPGGAKSTFASGLSYPEGLALNSAGDLFAANDGNGTITEITPGGVQSLFASGLDEPTFLAFQAVPEPSIMGLLAVGAITLLVRRRNQTIC